MSEPALLDNRATADDIVAHFHQCEPRFIAAIAERIALQAYAEKIVAHAWRTEAWQNDRLTGLVAAYFNAPRRQGFITHVSVLPQAQQCGTGSRLLIRCIERLTARGATEIHLEVDENNLSAQRFYLKHGFICGVSASSRITMTLHTERTL